VLTEKARDKTRRVATGAVAMLGLGGLIWGVTTASAGWRQPERPPADAWVTLPPTAAGPGPATPAAALIAASTAASTAARLHPGSTADDASAAPPPQAAASAASAEDRAAFQRDCVQPLREQHYRQAVRQCSAYTDHAALSGQAHAALAAAYSAPGHADLRASARHAESAAAAGDARGKFMAALHLLAGRGEQPFDMGRAEAWLDEAAREGVPNAQHVRARLDDAYACRRAARFRLLDAPIFCLLRPELEQVLREQGMTASEGDPEEAWSARWQPGPTLAGAAAAQLDYDRDTSDELLRLARFAYRFEPAAAHERLPALAQALQRKYGPPHTGQAAPVPGAAALWRLADGVELRLLREVDGALIIEYRHAARWQARAEHWAQALRAQQLARLRRDEAAL